MTWTLPYQPCSWGRCGVDMYVSCTRHEYCTSYESHSKLSQTHTAWFSIRIGLQNPYWHSHCWACRACWVCYGTRTHFFCTPTHEGGTSVDPICRPSLSISSYLFLLLGSSIKTTIYIVRKRYHHWGKSVADKSSYRVNFYTFWYFWYAQAVSILISPCFP